MKKKKELQTQCSRFRNQLIDLFHSIRTKHPGGSLSCTEILTALCFEVMNVDPQNPAMEGRDHLVLSEGHAAPVLYLVLVEKGFFPKGELKNLRQTGNMPREYPCVYETPGVELSMGPLGLELPADLGMALSARIKGRDSYAYMIMGDGEIQEGCVWETVISAFKLKVNHLIGFLDNNGVQLDETLEKIMPMGSLGAKWKAFGWSVISCDGHDMEDICRVVKETETVFREPSLILAKTVKGKGVPFIEGRNTWHGRAINDEEYTKAKTELGGAL